jgi:hypothetical protein
VPFDLVDWRTGARRTVVRDAMSMPVVSPDHREAVYLAAPGTGGHHAPVARVMIVDLATGAARPLTDVPSSGLEPIAWIR